MSTNTTPAPARFEVDPMTDSVRCTTCGLDHNVCVCSTLARGHALCDRLEALSFAGPAVDLSGRTVSPWK
jgi:hypothetical protein